MLYRKIPKTGEEISILGYGTMRFPGIETEDKINVEKTIKQVKMAIDKGVNYFDTAYTYPGCEEFIGEHLVKAGLSDKIKIATKLPLHRFPKADGWGKRFNIELERLHVDCIDFYLLHGLLMRSWLTAERRGIKNFMDHLKAEGKIRYMGFSYHGEPEDFPKIIDSYDWDFVQIQFNLMDENYQAGLEGLNYAAEKNLPVMIMEPLRGGTLSGKVPKEVEEIYNKAPVKRSPVEWALRWIWDHPGVICVLSGMNEEAHIEENVRIASEALPNSLTEEELSIIDQVKETYLRLQAVGCTGCRYCMPCPAGINIPFAFKCLNDQSLFGDFEHNQFMYLSLTRAEGKWTTECEDCGECEEACPQQIEIRKEFKKVQEMFENDKEKFFEAQAKRKFE